MTKFEFALFVIRNEIKELYEWLNKLIFDSKQVLLVYVILLLLVIEYLLDPGFI
jgi:hypothetical protein